MRRSRGAPSLRGPLGIVAATVVVDLIGFGIVLPVLPLWAEEFGASPLEIGLLTAVYSLMQFLVAPLWGRASDRVGRRPVILVALAGSAVAALLVGLAGSLAMLFVARILQGAAGASYVAAQAYVADVTTARDRARGMGLIGAAFGVGFVLGPAIGAVAAAAGGASTPFFVASGLAALNLVVAWFRLPESRRPGAAPARGRASRWALLRSALSSRRLGPLVLISFLGTFAFVGMESTFALFGDRRFGYGFEEVALLFAYVGLAAAASQGALVGRLVDRAGEFRVMLAGLVGSAVGMLLLALAEELWLLLIALALLGVATGLVFATVAALTSLSVGEDEQGGALGLLASSGGLARIAGPIVATALFGSVGYGSPLVLGAALFAACAVVAALALPRPEGAAAARGGPAVRDV